MFARFVGFFSKSNVQEEISQNLFDNLPNEKMSEIVSLLDLKSAARFSRTCHRMHEIVGDTKVDVEYGTYNQVIHKIKQLSKLIEDIKPSLFLRCMANADFCTLMTPVLVSAGLFGLSINYFCPNNTFYSGSLALTCGIGSMATFGLTIFASMNGVIYGAGKLAGIQVQQSDVKKMSRELNKITRRLL